MFFHRGLPSEKVCPYFRRCIFHAYLNAFASQDQCLADGHWAEEFVLRILGVFNKPTAPKMLELFSREEALGCVCVELSDKYTNPWEISII